jgi:hypothetical protein
VKTKVKINETLLAGIVAFIALIGFVIWIEPTRDNFLCPNDYRTAEEYIDGIFQWASEELERAPGMTTEELLKERARLFIQHNCEKSRWTDELYGEPENPVYRDEVVAVAGRYKIASKKAGHLYAYSRE